MIVTLTFASGLACGGLVTACITGYFLIRNSGRTYQLTLRVKAVLRELVSTVVVQDKSESSAEVQFRVHCAHERAIRELRRALEDHDDPERAAARDSFHGERKQG